MIAIAESGDVELQLVLAEIYDSRLLPYKEIGKDNSKAANWYLKAAMLDNSFAQRRLVRLYALGMGVPKNYFEAAKWYLKSQF